jgi:hypothetical protein
MVADEIAAWDEERARNEFDNFHDWSLRNNRRSYDWPAEWRNWTRRGKDYDGKHNRRSSTKGLEGALAGIKKCLDSRSFEG